MKAVFADTAYYLALLNEKDELHAAALVVTGRMPDSVVTTAWVLAEFG
jgi:predicted nucleic acid-binding protein